jgi:hypothetical protein
VIKANDQSREEGQPSDGRSVITDSLSFAAAFSIGSGGDEDGRYRRAPVFLIMGTE